VWLDGSRFTYTNWNTGQPNNKQEREHYLLIWAVQDGKWSDQPNVSTQHRPGFVCQWDQPDGAARAPAGKPEPTTPLPRDRWFEPDLTKAPSGAWGPTLRNPQYKTFEKGVLSMDNGTVNFSDSIRARDISIRAQFKFIEGQNMGLTVRMTDDPGKGGYYAWCARAPDGTLTVGLMGPPNLKGSTLVQRKGIPDDFFEFKLTAVDDLVTVHVNGDKVIEVRDRQLLHVGYPALNAWKSRGLIKDVEVKILDK
jgi:hypothetical protein